MTLTAEPRAADAPAVEIPATATTDLVVYDPATKSIDIATPVAGMVLKFVEGQRTLNAAQMQLLAPLGIGADWDPGQVLVYLMDCKRRGFDPWAKETYLMKYPGDKYINHIGIAGFRGKAEDTGEYGGIEGPFFSADGVTWSEVWPDDTTVPKYIKAGVIRKGFTRTQWATISYTEFAPMTDEWAFDPRQQKRVKTGKRIYTPMWLPASQGGKPMVMSGKCVQAAAFRITFPRRFSGWYEPAELEKLAEEARTVGADGARKAAYVAAQQPATTVAAPAGDAEIIDGEVVPDQTVDPWAQWGGAERARELLLGEVTEQAEIFGRPLVVFTERWSQKYGGRLIASATAGELAVFATPQRRHWVVERLRIDGRDAEADVYEHAPQVGTCQELFGRGPAVVEPGVAA